MKIVTIKVNASLAYQISYRYLKLFMSYRALKSRNSDTHGHTFLDVLDYFEYSDISISILYYMKT